MRTAVTPRAGARGAPLGAHGSSLTFGKERRNARNDSYGPLLVGCGVFRLVSTDGEIDSFFDRQIGRVLPQIDAKDCDVVPIRDAVVEYIPRDTSKTGWGVAWQVDTTRAQN